MRYPLLREWQREIGWLLLRFFRWITRRSIKNCQTVLIALGQTEKELEKTKKELQKAQDQLRAIKYRANAAAKESAKTLSSGNVPRGQWSFSLGQNELANPILRILKAKQHKPHKSKVKMVTGWLGRL